MGRAGELSFEAIERRVRELGDWFHNMDLRGVKTAPHHFLGDYPAVKWRRFAGALPADLSGRTVLDIGCNAGFYAIEMKKRGAERVVAIDSDRGYLEQARFAAEVRGVDLEFRELSVYDVAALGERFDVVLFLGVLYHLRHPLLALDLIREHVARDLLVFQSMQRGSAEIEPLEQDYPFQASRCSTGPASRNCTSSNSGTPATRPTGGRRTGPARRRCCAAPASPSWHVRRRRCSSAAARSCPAGLMRSTLNAKGTMLEAVMIWSQPDHRSHRDTAIDPDRSGFAEMARVAGAAIA